MNDPHPNLDRQIDRLQNGAMDRQEFAAFEACLLADPALRRQFRSRMRMEANLYSESQAAPAEILPPVMLTPLRPPVSRGWTAAAAGIAALLALAAFLVFRQPDGASLPHVAQIVSEDGAAWSGGGMIGLGAELVPGTMRLEQGLASLHFKSGVVADLEAPVTIELLDPMRCRLTRGKAVFDVPESAVGFVVETPNGHAVDHGTRFAVSLEGETDQVEFGVLSGRISVHHEKTRSSADIRSGDMVRMTPAGIGPTGRISNAATFPAPASDKLRFRSNGNETSIILCDMRDPYLDPTMLMVKWDLNEAGTEDLRSADGPKDRRSLIAFELAGLGGREVANAALRLNLVPSGMGYARLLADSTEIEVYGIRDDAAFETWPATGLKWADAPGSTADSRDIDHTEVTPLGSFRIERSRLSGPVVFESPELSRFVDEDQSGTVAFLLVSNTMPLGHWSLVHAFASSLHPEAAGPMLEVEVK